MSRPTPKTDALDCELHNPRVLQDRYSEMMEHSQNMERERDEARELARQISDSNQVLMADARFYRNAWEKLKEIAK